MKVIEPETVSELLKIFNNHLLDSVFRGVKKVDHKLLTTLSRHYEDVDKERHLRFEHNTFLSFKKKWRLC